MTAMTAPSNDDHTRRPAGHPTAQRLVAYQAGHLAPDEEDEVQEHLASCRECTEALLALPEFQELMEAEDLAAVARPEELPGPSDTQASWQALRARLAASRPVAVPAGSRFRRLTSSSRTFYVLAASLLACLIGFPWWLATHGGAGAPIPVYLLGSSDVTRGVGDSGQPVTLRLAEAPAVLVLPLPARASFPGYRIEVRTRGGEIRLSANALPIPVAGDRPPRLLALSLGRGRLAAGDYRLRLVGVRGSHGEVIAEHALRVPAS